MISNALEDNRCRCMATACRFATGCMWRITAGRFGVLEKGRDGEIYNIGGNCSLPNKTVVEQILAITGKPASLIEYVTDRPGHDRRYALSSAKLKRETGWSPRWISSAA